MKKTLQVEPGEAIALAKRFVEKHFKEELSVVRVANEVGQSNAFRFLRLFEETERLSFSDFVSKVRVAKAKDSLWNPSYTETEIALGVGFNNVTTFRRAFIRVFGKSPTLFRKSCWLKHYRKD